MTTSSPLPPAAARPQTQTPRSRRPIPAGTAGGAFWLLLVTVAILAGLALWLAKGRRPARPDAAPLLVFCAAGLKPAVAEIAAAYEKELGRRIELQYGGSGTLLNNLEVARRGDLYLAADSTYLDLAAAKGLVAETIPVAAMRAVIAFKRGNPKHIAAIADLARDDVRLSLANPEAASIGRTIKEVLAAAGRWDAIAERVRQAGVFKPTVNDVANDLVIGSADAGILWDAVVAQYPELDSIPVPEFDRAPATVVVGVLTSSEHPTEALRFARYLTASDRGLAEFKKRGYGVAEGDDWAAEPELVLFSGGLNRRGIEQTLKDFEAREGVRVNTVYNGCGILVGQMRAGAQNDAYFACDTSYMEDVAAMFGDRVTLSQTDMVLVVAKGNPKNIRSLADLAQPGVRVAVANARYSALGGLTDKLLAQAGLLEQVKKNVTYGDATTADYVVSRVHTGREDAGIVYRVNTLEAGDKLDVIPIDDPAATARQPIAVNNTSRHKQLMGRLIAALRTATAKQRFEDVGFIYLGDRPPSPPQPQGQTQPAQ